MHTFVLISKATNMLIYQHIRGLWFAEKEGFELRAQPSKNLVKIRRFRASSLSQEQDCATFQCTFYDSNALNKMYPIDWTHSILRILV